MTKIITKSKWFIIGGLIITFLQLLFDTLNVAGLPNTMWLGAFIMLGSLIYSGLKQYFDDDYDNVTLWVQVCLFGAYFFGGILDNLDLLPFNEEWKSIIRTVLTALNSFIPIVIKTIQELPDKGKLPNH